jgi:phosphoribosylamine--glycine ligase
MLDAINGKDTLKIKTDVISASVVMALPDFPYSHVTNRELCDIPIYGAEDLDHVHFSEVMMGVAPREVNGKVVDLPGPVTAGDYTLVVTGEGETVSGARRSVYAAIKKISVPNSPFYRIDIGAKLRKQLPLLQKLGYATGLEF